MDDLEKLEVNMALAEKLEIPFYKEAINLIGEDILGVEKRKQEEKTEHSKITDKIDIGGEDCFQYYQARNTRMFLHPINNRCLIEEFLKESKKEDGDGDGDVEENDRVLPNKIIGKVVD